MDVKSIIIFDITIFTAQRIYSEKAISIGMIYLAIFFVAMVSCIKTSTTIEYRYGQMKCKSLFTAGRSTISYVTSYLDSN